MPILPVVSWTGKTNISPSPFAPENLVSWDGSGNLVPRQSAHLHTQAESGTHLRDSSRFPQRRPYIYLFKPPYAIGSVPSLSGYVIKIAYRRCSLPRLRQHRASKPQRSSKRVLPSQVTVEQLICALYISSINAICSRPHAFRYGSY